MVASEEESPERLSLFSENGLARARRSSLRGLLGGTLFFYSSSLEDVREGIISFVTGVFIDRTLRFPHGNLGFPGPGKRCRIVDREFVADRFSISPRETLDQMQVFSRSSE